MRPFAKRNRPVKVHTGRAVAKQLAGASPERRHMLFVATCLGTGGAGYSPLVRHTDGGPARPSFTKKRKRPAGRKSRAAARRDHARRRRTPGGAYLP